MNYDVVIIGAGPAGIAAGHSIINNNISCCIIDKQVFPRNKLCAGGITQKTYDLLKSLNLGSEFKGESTVVSKDVSLYLKDKYITDIECGNTYLVDRFEFDEYLVRAYENKGGELLENTKVKSIDTSNNIITLDNNETITFKYIIGADGAVGITRSLVDKNIKSNGFCLQVDIDKSNTNYNSDKMSMYYGVLPYGYGWIFPKKNHLSVGFIGDYDKNLDYKGEFEKFLNSIGINCDRNQFKGAFIPFGQYINNPINKEKNLLLVGDAAGFVDPISGEGIYFAVLSGIKAAETIIKSIKNNDVSIIDEYSNEICNITNSIKKGSKLKKLVYSYKTPIFNSMKNKKIGSFIFNDCLYNSNYDILKTLNNNLSIKKSYN